MDADARAALDIALRRLFDDFGADVVDEPALMRGALTDLLGEHARRDVVDAVLAVTAGGVTSADAQDARARLLAAGVEPALAADVVGAWSNAQQARLELHGAATADPPPTEPTLEPPVDDDVWGEPSTQDAISDVTTPEDADDVDEVDDGSLVVIPGSPPRPVPDDPPVLTGERRSRRTPAILAAAAAAVVALVVGGLALAGGGDGGDTEVATDDSTTTTTDAEDEGDDGDGSSTSSSSTTSSVTSSTTSTTVEPAGPAGPTGTTATTSRPTDTTRPPRGGGSTGTTATTVRTTTTTATTQPPPPPPAPQANNDTWGVFPEHNGSAWQSVGMTPTENDEGTYDRIDITSYPDGGFSQDPRSQYIFQYSPYKNGPYTDSFSYRLTDVATGRTSSATVTIYVDCNQTYPCGS